MSYNIYVKQGNLLNEKEATFIVNASNTTLTLGSGVSMAFKRHCGYELQKEMTSSLKSIGEPLIQGDVVVTSSCNATNFIYALHVAIMNYNKGAKLNNKLPTLNTVEEALKNIENYLIWYWNKKEVPMKLVLPLMGCGVGGLDKNDVIQIYQTFFTKTVDFECDVCIYGYNSLDYGVIKSYFNSV